MWGHRLQYLWSHHRLASLAFLTVTLVVGFLLVRFVVAAIYWADPAHRDQDIEGWMTPHYVARSWAVPPRVVFGALGIEVGEGQPRPPRQTLSAHSASASVPFDVVETEILSAIEAFRATK